MLAIFPAPYLASTFLLTFLCKKNKARTIYIQQSFGRGGFYSVLADLGYFPKNKIAYYLKKYPLPSKEVPGIVWSGGSLGMGLSVAAGNGFRK